MPPNRKGDKISHLKLYLPSAWCDTRKFIHFNEKMSFLDAAKLQKDCHLVD
jgi:hypothetical protein